MKKLKVQKDQVAVFKQLLTKSNGALEKVLVALNNGVEQDEKVEYSEEDLLLVLNYLGKHAYSDVAAILNAFKAELVVDEPVVEPEVVSTPPETELEPKQ